MGVLCCKKAPSPIPDDNIIPEKEVVLSSYSSDADKEYSKLETKFNLLRDLSFSDYIFSLSLFSVNNATLQDDYSKKPESYSSTQPFYNEDFSPELLQSFIENKLLKHSNLYTKAGEDEMLATTFKEMLLQLQKNLSTKLKQHNQNRGIPQTDNLFKKYHAIALGLLYCGGQNVFKIKTLFNLFAENGVLKKSEALENFLLALFLIPSYCMLAVRNKINKTNQEIEEFSKDTMKKLLDASELKDSEHLVGVTNNLLFPTDGKQYSYEEFKGLFTKGESSLGWLISAKGVRSMLEKNNI